MAYDFERNLTNHPPRDESVIEAFEGIRARAKSLAVEIDNFCPDSREKSLAFTNLEQTVFWAVASIARDGH